MVNKQAKIGSQMDESYASESFSEDPKKGRLMSEIPFDEIKAGGFYQFEIIQAAAELSYLFNGNSQATAFYEKFFRYEFIDLRSAFIENDYKKWPLRRYQRLQEDKERIDFFEYSEQLKELLISIEKAWERETHVSLRDLFKTFPAAPIMSQALYHQFLENPPTFINSLEKYPGYQNYLDSLGQLPMPANSKQSLTPLQGEVYRLLLEHNQGLTVKELCDYLRPEDGEERSEGSITATLSHLREKSLARPKDNRPRRKIWLAHSFL